MSKELVVENSMTEILDMRKVPIKVNDVVIYGKSCRYDPVNIGTVVALQSNEAFFSR